MQKIKKYRNMKVCGQSGYRYKSAPTIALKEFLYERFSKNCGLTGQEK
ncbi:MAG: hypothetical protein NC393_08575 [Clostridium sp.]|nr:hypothetical protein [Clostridium sp.]MCM1209180.1 hypothetical protein [Ruminococcus sp.]